MEQKTTKWTPERLQRLDSAEFTVLWFATFGGPPAAVLSRPEMERVFLDFCPVKQPRRPTDRPTMV